MQDLHGVGKEFSEPKRDPRGLREVFLESMHDLHGVEKVFPRTARVLHGLPAEFFAFMHELHRPEEGFPRPKRIMRGGHKNTRNWDRLEHPEGATESTLGFIQRSVPFCPHRRGFSVCEQARVQ